VKPPNKGAGGCQVVDGSISSEVKQVDMVLGENEYKDASAYLKKYSPKNNSG